MAQQIQIRRDIAANWTSANPILAQGEMGLETNTLKVKFGDGVTAWNSLAYFGNAVKNLTDVTLTSLASGNIIIANASGIFTNQSMATLVNQLVSFSSLGSLAFLSNVDYNSIYLTNKPSLGSLAQMNQLSFTSLTNQPSLSSLAFQSTLDYTSNQLTNKPSLGSLAQMNQLSFTSLTNQPSLSSLAFQSTIDYTTAQLTNKPSLGSLAPMNQLSFTSLLNQPSLGSLAVLNSLTKSDVGLSNVTNDAQLKIASNLSDLNNIATARGNLSLGSLAVLNSVSVVLPSTASLDILYTNGIVNSSTVSTNLLRANQIFASTISVGVITGNTGIFASSISTRIIYALGGAFASGVTTTRLNSTGKIVSLDTITGANITGYNYGDQDMPFWGNGVDGNIYLDGSQTSQIYPFVTFNTATNTYTLTRDVYAGEFVLSTGYTLITSGWRIFAYTSINNQGTIHNNGYAASGASAGIGGLGGFFRAGGNGAAGLLAASAGAIGNTAPLPAANSMLGSIGGRGAAGRVGVTTFTGQSNSFASLTFPIGGKQLQNNYDTYMKPIVLSTISTQTQPTFSSGGGGGAKSIIGTTAQSGAGGGGGGVVFLASRVMANSGTIQSLGGAGGNATGTGGTFGGGGGGGGGTVVLLRRASDTSSFAYPDVTGGTGGTTTGTANTVAASRADTTYTSNVTLNAFAFTPAQTLNYNSWYIMSMHFTYTAGTSGPGVNGGAITGLNMGWGQLADVRFNSLATPTRALFVFTGQMNSSTIDQLNDGRIVVPLTNYVNSVRVVLDEIQNTSMAEGNVPTGSYTTNSSDSATTAVTNLGSLPTTNNTQYTVVATSGGTAFTAGTGVTILNSLGTTAPIMVSGVAVSRASSSITWTTAAAYGAFTLDLNQPTAFENGRAGMDGEVLVYYA